MNTRKFDFAIVMILLIGAALMVSIIACKEKREADVLEAKIEITKEKVQDVAQQIKKEANSLVEHMEKDDEYSPASVYNLMEVDFPPLFDSSCKTAKEPRICSEDKMMRFIKENAKFPRRTYDNASSLEQVIVVIGKDGSVSSTKYVVSGNHEACKGCQQAAADVIGLMDKWQPALKNGKPVAVQMTIPIKFEG